MPQSLRGHMRLCRLSPTCRSFRVPEVPGQRSRHACARRKHPGRAVVIIACSSKQELLPTGSHQKKRKFTQGKTLADHPCAKMWHPHKNGNLRPEDCSHGSTRRVWLQCPGCPDCGKVHEWPATPHQLTQRGGDIVCPSCASTAGSFCSCRLGHTGSSPGGRRKLGKGWTLADYPPIVDMLHPHKNDVLRPGDVSHGSEKVVWLQCHGCPKCGEVHEWQAMARNLTLYGGSIVCPRCTSSAGQFCSCRSVALAADPRLLAEWHEDNPPPETVAVGSNKKFKWRCSEKSCGHVWETTPNNRSTRGSNCPECARKRNGMVRCGKLTDERLDLAVEWDVARNGGPPGGVTCGSPQRVWWMCSMCGHSWPARVKSRANEGNGCPKCSPKTRGQLRKTYKSHGAHQGCL